MDHQAHIIKDEMYFMWDVLYVLPSKCKANSKTMLIRQKKLIASGKSVYASVATIFFVANYDNVQHKLYGKGIENSSGFAGASETAIGAAIVKKPL